MSHKLYNSKDISHPLTNRLLNLSDKYIKKVSNWSKIKVRENLSKIENIKLYAKQKALRKRAAKFQEEQLSKNTSLSNLYDPLDSAICKIRKMIDNN